MYKLTEIDQLLIEKYLDKTLTDSELTTFNQRLSDADFAAEVARFERAVTAVHAFGDHNLKAVLQAEEAKLQMEKAPEQAQKVVKTLDTKAPFVSKRPLRSKAPNVASLAQRWGVAATLILGICGGTLYFLQQKNTEKTESLYAAKFKPYTNYTQPTVRESAQKNDIQTAFSLYDNGAFKEAIVYFEKVKPAPLDVQFFQANAYLATEQREKAVVILKQLSENKASEWQQKAEWYLALSLSETDATKANVLFEKIKNTPEHPYQEQAANVLAH